MSKADLRWIQRFGNCTKAVGQMTKFIKQDERHEMEALGLNGFNWHTTGSGQTLTSCKATMLHKPELALAA